MKHTKKWGLIFTCMMVIVLFMLTLWVPAAFSATYESLHLKTGSYCYVDSSGTNVCEDRSGFKNRHDLTDSRILCEQEAGCTPPPDTKTMGVTLDGEQIYHFRVYVPPGTTYVYLRIDKANHSKIAAVSKLGGPPSDYGAYTYGDFEDATNSDSMTGASLAQLKVEDCIATDNGGILSIIQRYENVEGYTNVNDGWLYVDLYRFDGSLLKHEYMFTVNVDNYLTWYNDVNWDVFDETGGDVSQLPADLPDNTSSDNTSSDNTSSDDSSDTTTGGMSFSELICSIGGGQWVDGQCVTDGSSDSADDETADDETAEETFITFANEFDAQSLNELSIQEITQYVGQDYAVKLRPVMNLMSVPEGPVDFYAVITIGDSWLLADKDWAGDVIFMWQRDGYCLTNYKSTTSIGSKWNCDVFFQFDQLNLSPDDLGNVGAVFWFGYAPSGNLEGFHGAAFKFSSESE